MLVRWVFITDFVEEVDLVFVREQSGPNAVDRRVAPPLMHRMLGEYLTTEMRTSTNLIVETARSLQIVNISGVSRSTPEVHIGDFEIGPDYEVTDVSIRDHETNGMGDLQ